MAAHQLALARDRERPAAEHDLVIRQPERRARRIDQPHEEEAVGQRRERLDLAGADGQERALADTRQHRRRAGDVGDLDPAVERVTPPRRADQHQARHLGRLGGLAGVARDLVGEWVRGVDQQVDRLGAHELDHARDTAEAADPDRAGQRAGLFGAAGQRGRDLEAIVEGLDRGLGEGRGLGGAAENQQVMRFGRRHAASVWRPADDTHALSRVNRAAATPSGSAPG